MFAAPPDPGVAEPLCLRPDVRVEILDGVRGAELASAAARADILVVRSWQQVDAGVIAAGRGRLRAVVQASAGLDNIDAAAADENGVRVVGVDPGNATAVAELTLLSLLALFRRVRGHWDRTARGTWPDRDVLDDRELRGKALGLVGLGRVGRRVAVRARAFEMTVLAVDPYLSADEFPRRGAERVDTLAELLPRCAALSLHCPLTRETRHLIGAVEIAALPRGAYLVNTARGAVVDPSALVRALDDGHLAGAALDVFTAEPPPAGLVDHERVLATPHLGGHTAESHDARARHTLAALLALLDGREPPGYDA